MGEAPPLAPCPPQTQPQWWRIGRASLGFLLDVFATTRENGDVIDQLVMAVVVEANVAPVNQDLELSRRYSALDAPPPDDLRRPVSINAVAASLRLPYETIRRRVARLSRAGAIVVTPRGVYVPAQALSSPQYVIAATARYERLKDFYLELRALGACEGLPLAPPDGPPHAVAPVRAANRAVSEYVLRVIEAIMRRLGDPLAGLVLLEMTAANAEHLPASVKDFDGPLPDHLRTPLSVLALARRLGLPPETVRRHVRKLEENGFCRRVKGGRLAALEQLGRNTSGPHGLAENLQNIQRLITRCAALGLVAHWDAEA